MADQPLYPDSEGDSSDDTGGIVGMAPNRESSTAGTPPTTPRWVKAFGIIILVLVVLFIILHLAFGGLGGHTLR